MAASPGRSSRAAMCSRPSMTGAGCCRPRAPRRHAVLHAELRASQATVGRGDDGAVLADRPRHATDVCGGGGHVHEEPVVRCNAHVDWIGGKHALSLFGQHGRGSGPPACPQCVHLPTRCAFNYYRDFASAVAPSAAPDYRLRFAVPLRAARWRYRMKYGMRYGVFIVTHVSDSLRPRRAAPPGPLRFRFARIGPAPASPRHRFRAIKCKTYECVRHMCI